jgi:alginate O-acetyltransferase complex protein AlgI
MLFNSIDFLIFLPVVFILYWFVFNKSLKAQNILILLSSYVFYGWWDYRFLTLIFLSTVLDYFVGLKIKKQISRKKQKFYLCISILFNLSLLGFFKYYNFFIDSWIDLFSLIGYEIKSLWTLNIILPVGISFYTFQTMSYTIDVYRKKLDPAEDFISFASFVSFFPQLVAGPIERATNLLPQRQKIRVFKQEQATQGLRLIIWGMFKKVVIADSLANSINNIFSNYELYGGLTLWLGAIYFAFQIYCDFSGYSDIAIGVSKLLGIDLKSNFKFPYFSRNIGEFWRRWHISLSTWFRDYLYIPLGGSKMNQFITIRNTFIIFIVSGFWHGANWTFIFWGFYHAVLFLPSLLLKTNRKFVDSTISENLFFPKFRELFQMLTTFSLVTIGWVFFRAENINQAFIYLINMFYFSEPIIWKSGLFFVILLLFFDWIFRKDEILLWKNFKYKIFVELILIVLIISYAGNSESFIYFQF